MLSIQHIQQHCQTLSQPIHIDYFDTIDSTNSYLLNKTFLPDHYYLCLAENQTAGRGRLNREWYSPHGENIYLSLAFLTQAQALNGLSLTVGLAAIKACYTLIHSLWPDLIKNEHPQIIATILVHLEFDHAGEIMKHFTERLRNDVLLRIATLDGVQPAALKELNEALTRVLSGSSQIKKTAMGGTRHAAETRSDEVDRSPS